MQKVKYVFDIEMFEFDVPVGYVLLEEVLSVVAISDIWSSDKTVCGQYYH